MSWRANRYLMAGHCGKVQHYFSVKHEVLLQRLMWRAACYVEISLGLVVKDLQAHPSHGACCLVDPCMFSFTHLNHDMVMFSDCS